MCSRQFVHLMLLVVEFCSYAILFNFKTAEGYGTTTGRMALSRFSTCVVLSNLTCTCFGTDYHDAVDSSVRLGELDDFNPGGPIINTVSGYFWRCGLYSNSTVGCVGLDQYKVLTKLTGKMAKHNHDIIQIAAGRTSACMLNVTGSIFCWGGKNSWSSFGFIQNREHTEYPTDSSAPPNTGYAAVSVGNWHTCALHRDGHAFLWGYQTTYTSQARNFAAGELQNVANVHCGDDITCLVYVDGSALCRVSSEWLRVET